MSTDIKEKSVVFLLTVKSPTGDLLSQYLITDADEDKYKIYYNFDTSKITYVDNVIIIGQENSATYLLDGIKNNLVVGTTYSISINNSEEIYSPNTLLCYNRTFENLDADLLLAFEEIGNAMRLLKTLSTINYERAWA